MTRSRKWKNLTIALAAILIAAALGIGTLLVEVPDRARKQSFADARSNSKMARWAATPLPGFPMPSSWSCPGLPRSRRALCDGGLRAGEGRIWRLWRFRPFLGGRPAASHRPLHQAHRLRTGHGDLRALPHHELSPQPRRHAALRGRRAGAYREYPGSDPLPVRRLGGCALHPGAADARDRPAIQVGRGRVLPIRRSSSRRRASPCICSGTSSAG